MAVDPIALITAMGFNFQDLAWIGVLGASIVGVVFGAISIGKGLLKVK